MPWKVSFYTLFDAEFDEFSVEVQDAIYAKVSMLETIGPSLGRPIVDSLSSSKHANLKELRLKADDGVWRVAFAFDPRRQAILLVAGDKSGMSSDLFYKQLIKKAEDRLNAHLVEIEGK